MAEEMMITFPGGLRVDAAYKGFTISTDQPVYAGGEGSAPAPFDLFLASIGACAGFYVLAFCRERKIPPEKSHVVLRTEKNPETKRIGKIILDVHLPREFPEKYLRAVKKAVDGCSVKRHIMEAPQFELNTLLDT
ncbi:MAG: OsmC family protein [Acidobacteriota bacterium]